MLAVMFHKCQNSFSSLREAWRLPCYLGLTGLSTLRRPGHSDAKRHQNETSAGRVVEGIQLDLLGFALFLAESLRGAFGSSRLWITCSTTLLVSVR